MNQAVMRDFLLDEFNRIIKVNPKFSLRSFAKKLSIDPSSLSKLLKGNRSFSPNLINKIVKQLGITKEDLRVYELKAEVAKKNEEFDSLKEDTLKVLSEWHYFAILELINVENFRPCVHWVSKVLNLDLEKTKESVELLKNLNLLKIINDGENIVWIDSFSNLTTIDKQYTSKAFKDFQINSLNKAIEAIDKTSLSKRSQSTMTFPASVEKMQEAKLMIDKFRRELADFLNDPKDQIKDEVYNLSISLYPLSDCYNEEQND